MSDQTEADEGDSKSAPIMATVAVEMPPNAECSLIEEGSDVDVLDQNLTFDFVQETETMEVGECHTNVADEGGHSGHYVRSDVNESCVCLAFHEIDCVPTIRRVEGEKLIISVMFPDREQLRKLVDRIRETGASLDVYRITRPGGDETGAPIVMDVSDVTDKQLEALEAAIETGYYKTPREADLETLAERLGISKSAVSQRLKAVESRIVHKIVDEFPELSS